MLIYNKSNNLHTNLTNELHFDTSVFNLLHFVLQCNANSTRHSFISQKQVQLFWFSFLLCNLHCLPVFHIV